MQLHMFDLDGTLTDSRGGLYACFRAALAELGHPPCDDATLAPFLGTPLPRMFRTLQPDVTDAAIARGIEAFRAEYDRTGLPGNTLYPGVREMLQAVRQAGRQAWVVTSKPEKHAKRVVQLLDLVGVLDGVTGAGLAETDTKTDLIARTLAAARVPAAEAMMLGDRHYDVVGALENRVTAVGALWGYGTRDELAAAQCREFAESPAGFQASFIEISC